MNKKVSILYLLMLVFCFPVNVSAVGDVSVMQSFNQQAQEQAKETRQIVSDDDGGKHKILFIMGVILLVLIFLTAGFGLAMVMHGKEVFIHHMVCAGATVFLSLAHAVTSIVWFFPY